MATTQQLQQQQPLRERAAFKKLQAHFEQVKGRHLRDLFREDADRGKRLTAEAVGLYFDYSKHRVIDETLRLLIDLARESGLESRRAAMFAGQHINSTEDRAVLHVALRAPRGQKLNVDGQD